MAVKPIQISRFTYAVNECVDLLIELRRLHAGRRLTAEAFVVEAMELAGCDAARLDAVGQALDAHPDSKEANRFVRKMSIMFRGENFPSPPRDALKMTNYGRDGTLSELVELRITAAEAVALAAKRAAERRPDSFGTATSSKAHAEKVERVTKKLNEALEGLRGKYLPKDLVYDQASLNPSEREKGLTRVTFKLCPTLSPGNPSWPIELVEHHLTATAGKRPDGRRERHKVKRRAAALAASA